MSMEIVSSPILSPTAMIMKDMIQLSKPVFVSLELNISEELVLLFQIAQPMPTIMDSNASAIPDIFFKMESVFLSIS
jgi:hypothetical protein